MSFGEISTSFINDLVNKAVYKVDTKTKLKFKLNGADCEIDTKKGVNLLDICKMFNIQLKDVKLWKSKNGSYLQNNFGEIIKSKPKEGEKDVTPNEKRKPIMTADCNYIDPRFIVQCLMGTSIDFNNWVTNIILGSLIYHEENDENSLKNYQTNLNEHINETQIELTAKFKEIKKENNKNTNPDEPKYLVFRFPTGDEGKPMAKTIVASKYTPQQKEKLTEKGKYSIQDFEFNNSPKILSATKKYLDDNEIVYNASPAQINLPDTFTEEYFDGIKDDMIKRINELVDELSKEPVRQQKKSTNKKVTQKLQPLEEMDEPIKEKSKPKTTSKTATKKEAVKNQKEVKEIKPPQKSAGKFNKYKVSDDEEMDFSFNSDDD